MKSFASDNYSGIHPNILQAIVSANSEHAGAYGSCQYTEKSNQLFKQLFGGNTNSYLVFNGTGANVLALKQATKSYNSTLCTSCSHIYNDETGAPEAMACKLIPLNHTNGKINIADIEDTINNAKDNIHSAQPKVISITQSTEYGTIYQPDEIKKICQIAKKNNLFVHMDGARISNAAATLNLSPKEFTFDLGVDIISFGGTKNGLMFGEAVVINNPELNKNFIYNQKNSLQLSSKTRFLATQFIAYLKDSLYIKTAQHSNSMAQILRDELSKLTKIKITRPVETNMVFINMPIKVANQIQQKYPFYTWDKREEEFRLVTNFDTTKEEIQDFLQLIKNTI